MKPGDVVTPADLATQHPVDPGNGLVLTGGPTQAVWSSAVAASPAGPLLVLTFRTESTTFMLKLRRETVEALAAFLQAQVPGMSPLLAPVPGPLPPVPGAHP